MNRLDYMEFYITNVCNLTCTGCNRFNNYKFKGFQRWTEDKHNRLQGPSWPPYSRVITDYPQWCLDEMCQVAYDRSKAWTKISKYATYSIDTDELFGSSDPHTLSDTLESLNCSVDKDFLSQWKIKNNKIYEEYKNLFSWTPNWCPPDGWPTVDITENIYE